MSALEKILDERQCVLERVEWQDATGAVYAYVLIKKIRLAEFKKALSERDVPLDQFGVVIAHGRGEAPAGLEKELVKEISKN